MRVVVDSHARMPSDAALLDEEGDIIQVVAINGVTNQRCRVIALANNDGNSVDLAAVVRHLGERGCVNVLAEAGEKLTGELFDLQLVDKVVAYLSTNKIIGGAQALTPVGGKGPSVMSETARLRNTRIEHLGNDIAVIGYVDYPPETDSCSAE